MATLQINNTILNFTNIFYVDSVDGNDTTGDGSASLPYQTYDKAFSMTVTNNNDCVFLKAGTYVFDYEHGLDSSSGKTLLAITKNITVVGEGYKTKIILDVQKDPARAYGINCELDGCTLINLWIEYTNSTSTLDYATPLFGGFCGTTTPQNLKVNNCVCINKSGHGLFYDNGISTTNKFINCTFMFLKYFGSTYTGNPKWINCDFQNCTTKGTVTTSNTVAFTSLPIAYFDAIKYLKTISSTLLNLGTGNNPDGSQANIGVYGGDYAWSQTDIVGSFIKNSIEDIQNIGDVISCRYTAPISGSVGSFSELGTTSALPIPVTSSATPDGNFYYVYVDDDYMGRKILVPDRNIQHSISWNTLNTAGIATGSGLPINYDLSTPLVAGYNFNESIATSVHDITGVTNSSTVSGTTIIDGVNGKARHFNNGDYIGFSSKVIPLGAKSIRFKFRSSELPTDLSGTIVTNISSTSSKYGVSIATKGTTGYLTYAIFNNSVSANAQVTSTINVCDGNWHDILLTWDGTATADAVKMYIDDMTFPHTTGTFVVETAIAGSNLTIGKTSLASPYQSFLIGDLDSLEIYQGVIDPSVDALHIRSSAKYQNSIRLLTGGISATDTDNEWYNYIVNSDLNGTIIAGDENTWNWSGIYSLTSTTIATTPANRVNEGNSTVSTFSSLTTATVNASTGFRPVLVVEPLSSYKYLFQDGVNIKTYIDGAWETIGIYITEDMFLINGMNDLTPIDDTAIRQLDSVKLLMYKG